MYYNTKITFLINELSVHFNGKLLHILIFRLLYCYMYCCYPTCITKPSVNYIVIVVNVHFVYMKDAGIYILYIKVLIIQNI